MKPSSGTFRANLNDAAFAAPKPGENKTGTLPAENADTAADATPVDGTTDAEYSSAVDRTAFAPGGGSALLRPQGVHNLLHKLRMRFPGLPIVPLPNSIRTVVLAANIAQDMQIPDRAVIMALFSTGSVFMSAQTRATIPTASDFQGDAAIDTSLLITQPCNFIFEVSGKRQLSFVASTPTTVQGLFYLDAPDPYQPR